MQRPDVVEKTRAKAAQPKPSQHSDAVKVGKAHSSERKVRL